MIGLRNIDPRTWRLKEPEAQRFAEHVSSTLRKLAALRILDGKIIENRAFAAGTAERIQHGLGRMPLGWFPVRIVAPWDVVLHEDTADAPTMTSTEIVLRSSAAATVSLVVF